MLDFSAEYSFKYLYSTSPFCINPPLWLGWGGGGGWGMVHQEETLVLCLYSDLIGWEECACCIEQYFLPMYICTVQV